MDSDIIAVMSVLNPLRWFIFRDNGQEITVLLSGKGTIAATSHKLTPEETIYMIEIQKQKDL